MYLYLRVRQINEKVPTVLGTFEHRWFNFVINLKFYPFTPDTRKLLLGCFANSEELIAASQAANRIL